MNNLKDEILKVDGCPMCDLWNEKNFADENFKKNIIHIADSFMVLKYHGEIIVVSRNHAIGVDKGTWGRILKYVRHEFGYQARILFDDSRSKYSIGLPEDHWCGVVKIPSDRWK